MSEREIKLTSPVPCPKCGTGHLLAFLIPHYEGEGGYALHKPFTHYEVLYRCSRYNPHALMFECNYESRL